MFSVTNQNLLFFLLCTNLAMAFLEAEPPLKRTGSGREDHVDTDLGRQPPSRDCDFAVGEWVFDGSYPLYDGSCPFLSSQLSCRRNGRPDSDYEKWRWQPHHCSIPRFNALDFLSKIRMKRVMLVGDSIMRSQWESLVCLVEAVIPTDRKLVSSDGPCVAFHALDFEASIEFAWAPFLVELSDDGHNRRVLHLDSIEENAKYWRDVDVLLFDSAHWWTHSGKWSSWDLYMEEGRLFKELNPMVAYEKGLTTWANWMDMNLDPRKTRVMFRSASARHNRENGWQCYKVREPVVYLGYGPRVPRQLEVVRGVLEKMSFPVYLLDVSRMSALRRDGHPSVYMASPDMQRRMGSDCSHWCLPGVPDSWNEMLYAFLL